MRVELHDDQWRFDVQLYLGGISPEWVKVELYADAVAGQSALRQPMMRGMPISGAVNGYIYGASVPASRPEWHFTPRISAYHPEVCTPIETGWLLWQR